MYYVYVLKCADATLYTGSTNDLKARVIAHNTSKTGAKYTRARRPVKIIYSEKFRTKSRAMKREWEVKKMKRGEKLILIKSKTLV